MALMPLFLEDDFFEAFSLIINVVSKNNARNKGISANRASRAKLHLACLFV